MIIVPPFKHNSDKSMTLRTFLMLAVSLVALSGCGSDARRGGLDVSKSTSAETLAVPPQYRTPGKEEVNSIYAPPPADGAANAAPESLGKFVGGSAEAAENLSSLTVEERLVRLEGKVHNMQAELDSTMPSIRNLVAIEGDMKNLVAQLSYLAYEGKNDPQLDVGEQNAVPPSAPTAPAPVATASPTSVKTPPASVAAPAPVVAKSAEKPAPVAEKPKPVAVAPAKPASAPASAPATAVANTRFLGTVNRVRIGEHPGKERFVIDFASGSIIGFDKKDGGSVITVTLSDTEWTAGKSWKADGKANLVQSYSVDTSAGNGKVVVTVKTSAGTDLEKTFELPPENASDGPKLVLDFKK